MVFGIVMQDTVLFPNGEMQRRGLTARLPLVNLDHSSDDSIAGSASMSEWSESASNEEDYHKEKHSF
jgi:hypothetical protein